MVASASDIGLYTSFIFGKFNFSFFFFISFNLNCLKTKKKAVGWAGIIIPTLGQSAIYFTIGMSNKMSEKQSLIEFNSKVLKININIFDWINSKAIIQVLS